MKFVARLITDRELDRGVQKFAPDQVNAEGVAVEWLKSQGKPGDRFQITETRDVIVATVTLLANGAVSKSRCSGTPQAE